MQSERELLNEIKPAADSKLRRLGIRLDYTISLAGEGGSNRKKHVELKFEDRLTRNLRDKPAVHVVLHELAHVFADHYIRKQRRTADNPEMRSLFGNITETRGGFAETFATYVMMDGDMSKIRHRLRVDGKSAQIYKQMEWMDGFIKSVASKSAARR